MRKLSLTELHRLSPEAALEAERLPLTIVLDNVRSALNVGSVFRSADAFRVGEVVLCGFTPQPPHRDILKTALGATESVPWRTFATTQAAAEALKAEGKTIVVLEQTDASIDIADYQPTGHIALVLGNEVEGVSETILSYAACALEIPQYGAKHSLNIAVAAGVALYIVGNKLRHRA